MDVSMTRINVSLPQNFLDAVDMAALGQGMSRSSFIRVALLEKMGLQNMVDLKPLPKPGDKQSDPDEELKKLLFG